MFASPSQTSRHFDIRLLIWALPDELPKHRFVTFGFGSNPRVWIPD
jgi:hypothetical protein